MDMMWYTLGEDAADFDMEASNRSGPSRKRTYENEEKQPPDKEDSKEVKSPHVKKIFKRKEEDLQLSDELASILNPVEEHIMALSANPELVDQFVKWAENVKKKVIIAEAQAALEKILATANFKFADSTIVKPIATMKRTTFLCNACRKYEGYPVDVTHHYFSVHYQYCVYKCRLCVPNEHFDDHMSLSMHLSENHKGEIRQDQEFGHKYVKRMYTNLKSASGGAHNVVVNYIPPKSKPKRSVSHNKITEEERKRFMQLFRQENEWRIGEIFSEKMPLLTMEKDKTVFKRFVHYKDRKEAEFPNQYVYMYPSYVITNGEICISYTIGCGTVNALASGNLQGWNSALRFSINASLSVCASAARANDKKNEDGDDKKEMSFILPQFTIIIYWTEKGTDSKENEKSSDVSLKMDARNIMTKNYDTFFVALYSKGNIEEKATEKIKNAISTGVMKLQEKVEEYIALSEK